MTSTTLTVRLPAELKDRLGELAERTRRTKSFLAGEAIGDYVERELAIVAGIERGLDDMKAERVVPHDKAMRRIRKTIDNATKTK
ncbi:MAG: CopG family ribbon-helix-helix protein [Proteobacteria bacterium]|nr:CopG family ribbon-helix-helix protein [Pseudomonadota bacterium]